MSIQMSANVDVECRQGSLQMSIEMSKTYRIINGQKAPKIQNRICRIFLEIYIFIHTHTQIPTKKLIFQAFSLQKCEMLGTDSKKSQCRLKRPANVEYMSMSMFPPNVDPIWSTSVDTLMKLKYIYHHTNVTSTPRFSGSDVK